MEDHAASVVNRDEFAKLAGIEIVEVGQGTARARMKITPRHLNGLGMVHGGAIFTLADLAFAAACNACGVPTVALNASISYLKATTGGTLHAEAAEASTQGKMGVYTIRVTDDAGEIIAMFQGLAYRKGPPSGRS